MGLDHRASAIWKLLGSGSLPSHFPTSVAQTVFRSKRRRHWKVASLIGMCPFKPKHPKLHLALVTLAGKQTSILLRVRPVTTCLTQPSSALHEDAPCPTVVI